MQRSSVAGFFCLLALSASVSSSPILLSQRESSTATITADWKPTGPQSQAEVRVQWSSISDTDECKLAWIGLYFANDTLPESEGEHGIGAWQNPEPYHFIDYRRIDSASKLFERCKTSGDLAFPVPNLRLPFDFRLYEVQDSHVCSICMESVSVVKRLSESKVAEFTAHEIIEKICSAFPSFKKCEIAVLSSVPDALQDLIDQADPLEICSRTKHCDSTELARTPAMSFGFPDWPLGVRQGYTNNKEVIISWNSQQTESPALLVAENPSDIPSNPLSTIAAETHTYGFDDLCGAHAQNRSLGYIEPPSIHSAVIPSKLWAEGLAHGQQYSNLYFAVGNAKTGVWSPVRSVFAPIRDGIQLPQADHDHSSPLTRLVIFGDMGTPPQQIPAAETVQKLSSSLFAGDRDALTPRAGSQGGVDAVLHIGDISYARGYGWMWDEFATTIEPVASVIPWLTTPGNHEIGAYPNSFMEGGDSYGECGVPYSMQYAFATPGQWKYSPSTGPRTQQSFKDGVGPGWTGTPWWSASLGGVHYVALSTEHNWTIGSPQYQWLEKDLQSVNRTVTPFIVVSGHRPLYTTTLGHDFDKGVLLTNNLEPLFYKHGVDLGVYGHVHWYERTCAAKDRQCCKDSDHCTVHITAGNAGKMISRGPREPADAWSQLRLLEYGLGVIELYNSTSMRFAMISDDDHSVMDEIWFHR